MRALMPGLRVVYLMGLPRLSCGRLTLPAWRLRV
nr:MAG TPA: hypothetical protein [Caudoviricetes sp.]